MKYTRWRILAGMTVAGIFLSLSSASAHEQMVLKLGDLQYFVRIGFADEPAFIGEPATIEFLIGPGRAPALNSKAYTFLPEGFRPSYLRVPEANTTENNLSVEVVAGEGRHDLSVVPPFFPAQFAHQARFIPTGIGPYSFRFFGKVDGAPFDVTAACVSVASHGETGQLHPPQWGLEELPVGVVRQYKAGAFPCPLARSLAEVSLLVTGVPAGAAEGQTPEEEPFRIGELLWPPPPSLTYGLGGLAAIGVLGGIIVVIRRWRSRRSTPLY